MRPTVHAEEVHAVEVEDVQYAAPAGERLLARVYRPRGGGPYPALVDVHGGAWSHFDRTVDANICRALAARGMVVVALDFRQAPDHGYPTAVADVVAGLRFVRDAGAELGALAAPPGLVGGSSGGHLALLAALRPNAAEYATTSSLGTAPVAAAPLAVAYVLALWPVADPLTRYHYLRERMTDPVPPRDRFFRPEHLKAAHDAFFGDAATMERASVPRIVAAGEHEALPPLWIAHPELDENVTLPMSEGLRDVWRSAGGEAALEVFPGVGHSFANFPGGAATACIRAMQRFVAVQLAR
ncbi:MAG: alpha/beta hydrolase [bacterium]|nr:alpha/beta hydrolase [bacterium]